MRLISRLGGLSKSDKSPRIILTADESMMSEYRTGMFAGFSTCIPQGIIPDWLFFKIFAPPVPRENGRAVYADHGLRLIEASLLANGFGEEEVAVVHPYDLEDWVGDETEIVGIGGHDFLGINPPTSEFAELAATGPPLNRVKFLQLLEKSILEDVKVVVGGKSAWQLADLQVMDELGIDHVHVGEGEVSVPEMFMKILRGDDVPRIVEGKDAPVEKIPGIRGGVIHGLVEIMRGCGRGCKFCTPGVQKLRYKPVDHILKDIQTNLEAGQDIILLHSEDVLRYGTDGIVPDRGKVIELFERVSSIEGVKAMGTSHIALSTAYHNPDLVEEISEIMMSLPGQNMIGTQTGIETGSPRLIRKYMRGKALPSPPEKWPEIVERSLGILEDNGWVPACTLINGLPGENRDDVAKTLELLDDIKGSRALIVPLNFVSMEGSVLSAENSFTVEDMLPEHWQVMGECIVHDAQIAREMKGPSKIGNPIALKLFDLFTDFLIQSAEKYAEGMRRGEPPRDYTKISSDYTVPKVLATG